MAVVSCGCYASCLRFPSPEYSLGAFLKKAGSYVLELKSPLSNICVDIVFVRCKCVFRLSTSKFDRCVLFVLESVPPAKVFKVGVFYV